MTPITSEYTPHRTPRHTRRAAVQSGAIATAAGRSSAALHCLAGEQSGATLAGPPAAHRQNREDGDWDGGNY
eukprot:gene170-biopygen2457